MACVASRLLDQVQQHPQKRELTSVAQRPHRQLIQTRRVRRDLPAPLTGFAVTTPQLLRLELSRGTELPIRVGIPVNTGPWLALRKASENAPPSSPPPPRTGDRAGQRV